MNIIDNLNYAGQIPFQIPFPIHFRFSLQMESGSREETSFTLALRQKDEGWAAPPWEVSSSCTMGKCPTSNTEEMEKPRGKNPKGQERVQHWQPYSPRICPTSKTEEMEKLRCNNPKAQEGVQHWQLYSPRICPTSKTEEMVKPRGNNPKAQEGVQHWQPYSPRILRWCGICCEGIYIVYRGEAPKCKTKCVGDML